MARKQKLGKFIRAQPTNFGVKKQIQIPKFIILEKLHKYWKKPRNY